MPSHTRFGSVLLAALTATFSCVALSAPAAVADDTVVFADAALRSCVNAALGQDGAADVAASDAASITSLSCANSAMADLTGIEALSGLRELIVLQQGQSTYLTSIAPLSALTSLESVGLSYSGVTDLTPLTGLGSLRSLTLQDSREPLADLTTVGTMAGLTALKLNYAGTFDGDRLAPLAALTSLETLQINGGGVDDLGPLRSLTALTTLEMSNNAIVDLEPLTALGALKYLNLNSNAITDPGPLGEIASLLQISVSSNLIEDASGLAPLTAVTYLAIESNALVDLEFLTGWDTLRTLTARNNEIADLTPLLGHARLTSANLSANRIVDASPLDGAREAALIVLTNQQVTLADILVGTAQANPLIDVDGTSILPTSATATVDEAANSWTFATAQRNTLTWSVPVRLPNGTTSTQVFSGTLTQRSIEQAEDGAIALDATATLAEGATGAVGDEVEYRFTVTNTGAVALADVVLADLATGLSDATIVWPGEAGTLDVGAQAVATVRYRLTAEDVAAGSVTGSAAVSGSTPLGTEVTDSAAVTLALPEVVPPTDPEEDEPEAVDPAPDPDTEPGTDPTPDAEPEDPAGEPTTGPTAEATTAPTPTATPSSSSLVSAASDGGSTADPGTGRLARTGVEVRTALVVGALLLVTGTTVAVLARTARRS